MPLDLHGAEIVEVQRPAGPITVGESSVIGLVGSAPDASTLAAASLALGGIQFTAAMAGAAGNDISVKITRPGGTAGRNIQVSGNAIEIVLAVTSGTVNSTETANALIAAVNADGSAAPLVSAALPSGGAGDGLVPAAAKTNLAGGRDDTALNVPMLIATAADVAALGSRGALPAAIRDVFLTAGDLSATVVAVRTTDDTPANLAGTAAARSGAYALLDAESRTGVLPRLLAAPGAADDAVTTALASVAADLRAVAVVSVDQLTLAGAIVPANGPDTENVYAVWPRVVISTPAGETVSRPADALVCGHIARVDRDESFASSPSNRVMRGVLRAATAVDFRLDDRSSGANLLNRANIATFIRRGASVYLWGNQLSNGELLAGRRARSIIGDELTDFVRDYIDRRVDIPFVEHIIGRLNGYLRTQVLAGNLASGRAWFDGEQNTSETLAANRVVFSFSLGLHAVAEQITFRQSVVPTSQKIIRQLTAGTGT